MSEPGAAHPPGVRRMSWICAWFARARGEGEAAEVPPGVPFPGMHEDIGAHAGSDPDPTDRAYRLDVLIDGVPEVACVTLMHRIADLLVEEGLASPVGGEVRASVAVREWDGRTPGGALHLVFPQAVPQSPDLGLGYSPN